MSTPRFELYVATKMYSSWSLRAWLACKLAVGNAFGEVKLPIAGADSPAEQREAAKRLLLKYSPTGKVPALLDRELGSQAVLVYESIAIVLHFADHFPSSGLLPRDPAAKALCISACAEMHAGFSSLRSAWPMNCTSTATIYGAKTLSENAGVRSDIGRIAALFSDLRRSFGDAEHGGRYLFGTQFSAADCMFAPVALRFRTYDPELESLREHPLAAEYIRSIWDNELVKRWVADALAEGEELKIASYEVYSDPSDK